MHLHGSPPLLLYVIQTKRGEKMATKDITEMKQTVVFHERLEPLLEYYDDEPEAFGRIMLALFKYSIDGEVVELKDKRENCDAKLLRNMVDQSRLSNHKYIVGQTIKSNVYVAESEDDLVQRLRKKGLNDDEVQQGIDKYRAYLDKQKKQQEDSKYPTQYPAGTSWDDVYKDRGYK